MPENVKDENCGCKQDDERTLSTFHIRVWNKSPVFNQLDPNITSGF